MPKLASYKMKYLVHIAFFFALLAFASCSKDEITSPGSESELYYPTQDEIKPEDRLISPFDEELPEPIEINDDEDDESGPAESPDIK
jgi:hypothetical protein